MPSDINELMANFRARAVEHQRRMAEDPEYRAAEEAREKELEARFKAECEENDRRCREANKRSRRVNGDMPPRVWSVLDDPLPSEALKAVQEFIKSDLTFLVLSGGIGCGKTAAACAIIDALGGRFVKAAGVTRARFNDEAWESLLDAKALVVDDLGTESLDEKGWAAGALAELFDHRYDWQAKTILTTNLDAEGFKKRYCEQDGGRFLSRLREAGRFVSVAQGSLRANNQRSDA